MTDLAGAFHTAQEAALRASTDLPAAMGLSTARIYTVVPVNAAMPYVVFGDDQVLEDVSGCAGEGEIFATVHSWSKPTPPQSGMARQIGAALFAALNAELALVGFTVDLFEVQDQVYSTDPDGSTHSRHVFHYLTTEQV